MDDDEDDYVEPEPVTLCDDLRLVDRGIFPQSTEELKESFDPFDDHDSTFLWDNY